jgi:hypothetical protein
MHRATHWGIFEKYRNDDEEDARKQPSKLTALGPGPELKKNAVQGRCPQLTRDGAGAGKGRNLSWRQLWP